MTSKISDEELVNLFNKNKLFNLFNMTVLEVNTDAGSIIVSSFGILGCPFIKYIC